MFPAKIRYAVALTTLLLHTVLPVSAQRPTAETNVIDTIRLLGKEAVIYENNTWAYLVDCLIIARDKAISDTMALFLDHWNNDITFSYNTASGLTTDTAILILQDSLRKFVLPHSNRIYSGFGWRGRRVHNGVDIALAKGTPVKAAFDGKVRYAKSNNGGYGKLIIIRHFNGLETYYSHLDRIYVEPDQIIQAGQVIGTGGNTGATWTSDHLHFETRYRDRPFDPMLSIDFEQQSLKSDTLVLSAQSFKVTKSHKGSQMDAPPQTSRHGAQYHVVKKGETLSHIAVKHHTTVNRLVKLNNLKPTSILQIGQKIRVR